MKTCLIIMSEKSASLAMNIKRPEKLDIQMEKINVLNSLCILLSVQIWDWS